jgi:hypothetical protein
VFLHTNSITEERATGERRAWVDRQDPHSFTARAERADQCGGSRGLTDSRRAGKANDVRPSCVWRKLLHDHRQRRGGVLDPADQPTKGTRIARPDGSDDVTHLVTVKRRRLIL